jgi:hypothetical protein
MSKIKTISVKKKKKTKLNYTQTRYKRIKIHFNQVKKGQTISDTLVSELEKKSFNT